MAELTPEDRELWRLTMQHSPVGMALLSPEGRYLRVNPSLCAMLGYTEEELTRLSFHHITHPDDLLDGVQLHQELLGDDGAQRTRKRYLRPDGSELLVDLSIVLQRDACGAPQHFITQVVDLTEKHDVEVRLGQAERQVIDEQLRTRAILDTDVVGLALIDLEGRFQAVNATQRGFFDLAFPDGHTGRVGSPGHIYDADQAALIPVDDIPSTRAARGEELDNVLCWAGPDPETRRALVISARNVPDSEGNRAGSAMVFHDVTPMMRAIRAKDEFVQSVSHELRTPLTSALGHLELLEQSGDLPPECRHHVDAAFRNVLRLSHLVADVLYASRAMSGSPLVDPHPVDLAHLVGDAVAGIAPEAAATEVEVLTDLPGHLDVVADGLTVRQALDNVLSNAVTYSPGGRVEVRLEETDAEVVVTVADTGEGIDAADLPHVFDRFHRGANARRRHLPGAGLGLSIARTVLEAHGGTASATSAPGCGTTVRLTLPR
ncbi:sensor histidine kinase [Nocardioides okcheonensis]|uniref:sensor histidine kinase n=1 Tax=Nocardioides okcheonensis TaxID=2894081 RepID=UPI001E3D7565|nr:PAS domain-containing sensor histidine kinase [Nocardioides okcheonensis]UFN46608.1 PAS domain S-box protein [Nocardioides okcheonensis]